MKSVDSNGSKNPANQQQQDSAGQVNTHPQTDSNRQPLIQNQNIHQNILDLLEDDSPQPTNLIQEQFQQKQESPDPILQQQQNLNSNKTNFSLFSEQYQQNDDQPSQIMQGIIQPAQDISSQQKNFQNSDSVPKSNRNFNQFQNERVSVRDDVDKRQKKLFINKNSKFQPYIGDKISGIGKKKVNDSKSLGGNEDSVFTLSENINKLLLEDPNENQGPKPKNAKVKRKERNLLNRQTTFILQTYQMCNARFTYNTMYMNPRRELTVPSEGMLNQGFDNIDGDYILRVTDVIITPENKEYEIQDLMGKGTFGQVVKCVCQQTKEMVAIKVIKNKKAFKNQGVVEIKILDLLNRIYDPNGESPLVRMLDFFVFRDHLCIVFELLSASVYDLIKENNFQGLSLNFSRLIISQILDAMKIVKDAKLIHCDLKPENILFKQKDMLTLKIIDFGSACFEGFAIFQYIQSRYYRSPEVILQLPYDTAIDMWSLGCIAAELFLGIPIFPGNSEYDQLAKIIEIVGLPPPHLIQKSKTRDKYFVFIPEIGQYRFKTFEEFQRTTGIKIDFPKKYNNLTCLDDLKLVFIEKKRQQQAQKEGKTIDQIIYPTILESELNSVDAFIDFLKGLLRIDKDTRWTPLMAKEHPFITRNVFTGPFEPQREQERISSTETGEDTQSEKSTSSKDSKEYKVGSCPSKILYPQSVSMQPQYLQQQQTSSQQSQNQQNLSGQDSVFHGANMTSQSHRPPILSIPDEYFKGFMFGRLDQILSMTREQLYQFVYEQNELLFRQNQQKMIQMHQQQYQQFLQQQQYQIFLQQQQLQYQQQNNPGLFQQQQQPYMYQNFQQPQGSFQGQGHKGQVFFQNSGNPGMMVGFMPPQQNMNQQLNQSFNSQMMNQNPMMFQNFEMQQFPNQMMGMPQNIQQPVLNEQTIFNPPPYQQLKQQLFTNAQNLNEPQQQMQNQRRNQGFKGGQRGDGQTNKGKAGSWHHPPGLQGHKYNQYYNQINNPGQIIGRPPQMGDPAQQQFVHQQFTHHNKKQNFQTQDTNNQGFMPQNQAFTKNDFKKTKNEKKNNQSIFSSIILEEQQQDSGSEKQNFNQQNQNQINQQYVPFPSNQQIFSSFGTRQDQQQQPFNQRIIKKQLEQNQNANFQEAFQKELQFPINPREQSQNQMNMSYDSQQLSQMMDPNNSYNQFVQQQNLIQGQKQFGSTKQFPSPKQQTLQMQQMQQQQQFQQQPQSFNNQYQQKKQSKQQMPQQQMESMQQQQQQQQSQGHGGGSGGSFIKRWEQANPKHHQNNQSIGSDKQLFNNSHHYQYTKFMMGTTGNHGSRNRSNSDINQQEDNKYDTTSSQNDNSSSFIQEQQFMQTSYSQQDIESPNTKKTKGGFESLQQQIKKQGLNESPSQPPHSAKGSYAFKFDQFQEEANEQKKHSQNQQTIQMFNTKQQKKSAFENKGQAILRLHKNQIEKPAKNSLQNYRTLNQSQSIEELEQQKQNIQEENSPTNQAHQNIQILGQSKQTSNLNYQMTQHIKSQSQNRFSPIVETGISANFGGVEICDSSGYDSNNSQSSSSAV